MPKLSLSFGTILIGWTLGVCITIPFQLLHYLHCISSVLSKPSFDLFSISISNRTDLLVELKSLENFYGSYITPLLYVSLFLPLAITCLLIILYSILMLIFYCADQINKLDIEFENAEGPGTSTAGFTYIFIIVGTFHVWVLCSPVYTGLYWHGTEKLLEFERFFTSIDDEFAFEIFVVRRYLEALTFFNFVSATLTFLTFLSSLAAIVFIKCNNREEIPQSTDYNNYDKYQVQPPQMLNVVQINKKVAYGYYG